MKRNEENGNCISRIRTVRLKTLRFNNWRGSHINSQGWRGSGQMDMDQWIGHWMHTQALGQHELNKITWKQRESNARLQLEWRFYSNICMDEPVNPRPVQAGRRTVETTVFFMKTVDEQ